MTRYILAETIADPAEAARAYEESIALADGVGADFVSGLADTSLAACELRAGRTDRARQRLARSIEHWQRSGVRTQQWLAVRLLIDALDGVGDHHAVAILGAAYGRSEHAGPAYSDDARRLANALDRARERLGEARYASAAARGASLDDDRSAVLAAAWARRPAGDG
jgi:hypothetical protein